MESEMFVEEIERIEPGVAVKDEYASTVDTEDNLGRFTPTRIKDTDNSVTPLSSNTGFDRGYRMLSSVTDQLNEKEQTKIRLAKKYQEISAAKEWLSSFPDWLRPKERNVPEVGDWIESIEAILKHIDLPRVVLGFMGPSGCGKSSVINALLDEESLLPCNCTEACTAVAVEVSWNSAHDRNSAYKAEIHFVSRAEWKAELDLLVAELITLEPEARLSPGSDEAKVAAAKIKAVYPDLAMDELNEASAAELMNDIVVSKRLGTKIVIAMSANRGKDFAAEISQYIDSSPRIKPSGKTLGKATPYWPLVKVVKIFTRSPVLTSGLVLVDLPGSGDSNEARTKIAQDYMDQISAICIVTDIRRALTSKVARSLFGRGEALKRRLMRNGLLDDEHTFFVLTCTDFVNNKEVIRTQGLEDHPEISHIIREEQKKTSRLDSIIEKRGSLLKKIEKRSQGSNTSQTRPRDNGTVAGQVKRQGTKRKVAEDETESCVPVTVPSLSDRKIATTRKESLHETCRRLVSNINAEEKAIRSELVDLNKKLSAICIRERNFYVTCRMKNEFAGSLEELEEELRDESDKEEEDEHAPQSSEDSIRDGIETFCVCSKAYQKFCGRFPLEENPVGFEKVEDTFLPQLMKHCNEYTLKARERLADVFLEDLDRLRKRMTAWADNTTPDREITSRQMRMLNICFTEHLECLKKITIFIIDTAAASLREDLKQLARKALKNAVPDASQKAIELFNQWTESISNVNTWRAICRKEGSHFSKHGTEFNWNDDLAEAFSTLLDKNLGKIAGKMLPDLHQNYKMDFGNEFQEFSKELNISSLGVTKHISNSLQGLMCNFETLQAEAQRVIDSRFDKAISMSCNIDRKIPPALRKAMYPGYQQASAVTGSGCFKLSKTILGNHIRDGCSPMYGKAAQEVSSGMEGIVIVVQTHLKEDFAENIKKIEDDFAKMLSTAIKTARPESGATKVALQKEVLEKLACFNSLLGELPETSEANNIMDPIDTKKEEEEEEDIAYYSETGYDEDDIDLAEYEREFGGSAAEQNLDPEDNSTDDPVLNEKEIFDEEHMHEN